MASPELETWVGGIWIYLLKNLEIFQGAVFLGHYVYASDTETTGGRAADAAEMFSDDSPLKSFTQEMLLEFISLTVMQIRRC